MSEMVERVAKAIAEKYAPAVDQRAPYAAVMMREAAKAAIEAMREPTKAMTADAARDISIFTTIPDAADIVWRRMVDAALKE